MLSVSFSFLKWRLADLSQVLLSLFFPQPFAGSAAEAFTGMRAWQRSLRTLCRICPAIFFPGLFLRIEMPFWAAPKTGIPGFAFGRFLLRGWQSFENARIAFGNSDACQSFDSPQIAFFVGRAE